LAVLEGWYYIQPKNRAKKELILSLRRCYSSLVVSSAFPPPAKVFGKGGLGEKLFSNYKCAKILQENTKQKERPYTAIFR
jgi:hypothetical protein